MQKLNYLTLNQIETILVRRIASIDSLSELPKPQLLKDIDKAVYRIAQAIRKKQKITLVGDYDVDGVISTSLMIMFFKQIGYELNWYVPDRFKDGYGLSVSIIERFSDSDLIITVDNGISAHTSAQKCQELGIDLIITDHHEVPNPPPQAYAIVNPKQNGCLFPYKDICGAQVAWYLIAALRAHLRVACDLRDYLELVGIAVIADMMPLKDINHLKVKKGLARLSKSNRAFIRAFKQRFEITSLRSEDISFLLAPLLNSAGRIEHAKEAIGYVLSNDLDEAHQRLEKLYTLNTLRKELESTIFKEALETLNPERSVIVAVGESWHEGVIGIVASRLAKHFQKPAIVLTLDREGKYYKGSGRSYGGCDLFRVVEGCKGLLEKFGGHQEAIGLSLPISHIEPFLKALEASYERLEVRLDHQDPALLGALRLQDVSWDLLTLLDRFEPYGTANPTPKFFCPDVEVVSMETMGEGRHSRFVLQQEGFRAYGVRFRSAQTFYQGDRVDIVYSVKRNRFNGVERIQLLIEEIRKVQKD